MVDPQTLTNLIEVNSTSWSSEMSVHGASPPNSRKTGIFTTANKIITVTTVDANLSRASNNISSLMRDGLLSNACCWNGFRYAAFVVRWVSHSSGSWAFSSSALKFCRIIGSTIQVMLARAYLPRNTLNIKSFIRRNEGRALPVYRYRPACVPPPPGEGGGQTLWSLPDAT